jgi:hypothetical protein
LPLHDIDCCFSAASLCRCSLSIWWCWLMLGGSPGGGLCWVALFGITGWWMRCCSLLVLLGFVSSAAPFIGCSLLGRWLWRALRARGCRGFGERSLASAVVASVLCRSNWARAATLLTGLQTDSDGGGLTPLRGRGRTAIR